MRDSLAQELVKIGLSEKEAKVYLAGLELGPATAQQLAAKAVVNRPTTYIMIESLIKRGLMSSFEKGRKRFFVASPPNQLLYLIGNQKKEILQKEAAIKKIIEDAGKIFGQTRTTARVFTGIDGIAALQDDILSSEAAEIDELTSLDEARKFIPPIFVGDRREKIARKFKIKTLYTSKKGKIEKEYESYNNNGSEIRRLDHDKFVIEGEVIVYGDSVCLSSYDNEPTYVLINDKKIAKSLHTMFMSLWQEGK